MHIEIDQSGKIEQLNKDSVIAFSNTEQYSIKLPKDVKQEISLEYRSKVKQFVQKLFAICLFYCLKDYLQNKELIVVDREYPGWEPFIKRELVNFVKEGYPNFDKKIIKFDRIGKKSNAHKLALRTFNGQEKPNKILQKKEVIKWLK